MSVWLLFEWDYKNSADVTWREYPRDQSQKLKKMSCFAWHIIRYRCIFSSIFLSFLTLKMHIVTSSTIQNHRGKKTIYPIFTLLNHIRIRSRPNPWGDFGWFSTLIISLTTLFLVKEVYVADSLGGIVTSSENEVYTLRIYILNIKKTLKIVRRRPKWRYLD